MLSDTRIDADWRDRSMVWLLHIGAHCCLDYSSHSGCSDLRALLHAVWNVLDQRPTIDGERPQAEVWRSLFSTPHRLPSRELTPSYGRPYCDCDNTSQTAEPARCRATVSVSNDTGITTNTDEYRRTSAPPTDGAKREPIHRPAESSDTPTQLCFVTEHSTTFGTQRTRSRI